MNAAVALAAAVVFADEESASNGRAQVVLGWVILAVGVLILAGGLFVLACRILRGLTWVRVAALVQETTREREGEDGDYVCTVVSFPDRGGLQQLVPIRYWTDQQGTPETGKYARVRYQPGNPMRAQFDPGAEDVVGLIFGTLMASLFAFALGAGLIVSAKHH
jgi:hypothetical protein